MSSTKLKAAEELIAKLQWGSCDGCNDKGNDYSLRYCPLCGASRYVYTEENEYSGAPGAHFDHCPVAQYQKTEY